MYVAVKGGERAIENAHRLLAHERRGDAGVPEVTLPQISEQLSLAVDRVMSEGSLYDRELAALAIKQARGDMIEAIFLVRAFRATLAPIWRDRAGRHRQDAGGASRVLDLQGYSGRTDPRADLRLHPSSARSRAGRGLRSRAARDVRSFDCADAAGHRHPRPRRPDRAVAAGGCGCAGRRSHPRTPELPCRSRPALAESRPRRRRLPARDGLFDPARLRPQPSLCRRNPLRRGRGRILRRRCRLRRAARRDRADRMPDGQPVQGLGDAKRRASPAAMVSPSARASARPCRWRWSIAPCARASLARTRCRRRRTRSS